jgi:hypothetical protein
MKNYISIAQDGDKSERVHQVFAQSKETQNTKVFTVKGVGKSFVIFEGTQQLTTFKTLTECKNFISWVSI